MRGVVTDGAGGFAVESFTLGAPGPGEVLVEIAASGVCHTDVDIARGAPAGTVLGHEGAGIVRDVGDGVIDVSPGDRVLLTWAIGCGDCFQCISGSVVLCERLGPGEAGHAGDGGTSSGGASLRRAFNLGTLSDATIVRREAVVKLDDGIPFASACILGCGVMTGYGSVVNAARVTPDTSVVVIGCGGVGLNVVQAARIAGAQSIVAVDVVEDRLEMARRFGATHTVHATDRSLEDAARQAREIIGARGADYAFECTGVPELCAAPLRFVRHGGTAVQVSGTEQEVTIDMRLFEWDKTYLNPLYGMCRPSVDFPRLFELYRSGELLLDELVTRTYSLDDVALAVEDMLAGRNAKGVVMLR